MFTMGVQLLGLVVPSTQFLVESVSSCPAPPPCTCISQINIIDCSGKGLTEVPSISPGGDRRWTVDLSYNQLTTIPKLAFANITVVSLDISHNQLSTMADDILAGSSNDVTSVHMEFNQYWYLPNAIDGLTNLTTLTMQNNAFIWLGTSMSFASTLRNLTLGSQYSPWPKYIDQFNAVTHLVIVDLQCSSLPFDAFFNMADTMKSLIMKNNGCEHVPDSVPVLKHLEHLEFIDNEHLTSFDIRNLTSLTSLCIQNSSLTAVPNISQSTHLQSLHITNSPVTTWEQHTLPPHPMLKTVKLDNTDFDSIPTALLKTPAIETLSMSNTNVSYIGESDLIGLPRLEFLDFSGSPVSSIAVYAFHFNKVLYSIDLSHTDVIGVPRAIGEVTSLHVLVMTGDAVDCTCNALGWLKWWYTWLKHPVLVSGRCYNNGMELMAYIRNYVPKCVA